ncbi:MAG: YajQ family cyclic di-GMP-binding protein [Thermodesulfobacteriota bacterium]
MASFDIVSKVNLQEVDNAVNQAVKEIENRYDFKGSKCEIRWDKAGEINLTGDSDSRLKTVADILETRLLKRGISIKALEYGKIEEASGGLKKQNVKIRQGIATEKAKEIVKIIKGLKLKVQAQIQDEQVRVTGKKLDDLQAVISGLKSKDLDVALQFVNMRS